MSDQQEKTYRVHGYCLVPCAAEVKVRASSEVEALANAKAIWAAGKMAVIDQGDCDFDAAFDWQPSVEVMPSTESE